jgi:DNA-binding FrmR family transcriptional regulator
MQNDKKQILNRLATIEGHLKGIRAQGRPKRRV